MTGKSDDDVSILSLSDDEGKPEPPPRRAAAPKATESAPKPLPRPSRTSDSGSGSKKAPTSNSKAGGKRSGRPEPVYEEYRPDSPNLQPRQGRDSSVSLSIDYDPEQDGPTSMRYISYRFARRQAAVGPTNWLEVDEKDIGEAAESLLKNVNQQHGGESTKLLQEILKTQGTLTSSMSLGVQLKDPLGMGTFGLASILGDDFFSSDPDLKKQDGPKVTNKWQKARSKMAATPASDAADAASPGDTKPVAAITPEAKLYAAATSMGLLPTEEGFKPEVYLGMIHMVSSLSDLQRGMKSLSKDLSERTGQLKQLIKGNFERFISCKNTIDDIFLRLQKLQADRKGVSTEKLFAAIEQAQYGANKTFGAVLDRSIKTDRIKSVSNLLRRFNNLFGMPGRIKTLAAEGELEQIVQSYHRATALIKPGSGTPRVWVSLYQEIERRVSEAYDLSRQRLQDPSVPSDAAPPFIIFMATLSVVEKLPGTLGEDPLKLYLETMEQYFMNSMQECDKLHADEWNELRAQSKTAIADARRLSKRPLPSSSSSSSLHASGNDRAKHKHSHLGPVFEEDEDDGKSSSEEEDTSDDDGDGDGGVDGGSSEKKRRETLKLTMLWSGFPSWSPSTANLPAHLLAELKVVDGVRASLVTGEQDLLQALIAMKGGGPVKGGFVSGTAAVPGLPDTAAFNAAAEERLGGHLDDGGPLSITPAQCMFVGHASRLTALLVERVPHMWAIAGSSKFTQVAPELVGPVRDSLNQAQALTTQLLGTVMDAWAGRMAPILDAMREAGAMQSGMELLIKELAGSLVELKKGGCTAPVVLKTVKCQLFDALGMYIDGIAVHLRSVPSVLIASEDWQSSSQGHIWVEGGEGPTTATLECLKDEITMALHSYRAMLEAASQVEPPPPQFSWQPLQAAFFGAFLSFSEATNVCARALEQAALHKARSLTGPLAILAASASQVGLSMSEGGAAVSGAEAFALSPGPSLEVVQTSSEISIHEDAKLLVLLTNASAVRTNLAPPLVEQYRAFITGGTHEGGKQVRQQDKNMQSKFKASADSLMSMYMTRKEAALRSSVDKYISEVSMHYASADASLATTPDAASAAGPGSWGVSDSCHVLIHALSNMYMEVHVYAPFVLKDMMTAVMEQLLVMLSERYLELPADCTELEVLLHLHLDLMYIDKGIVSPFCSTVQQGVHGGRGGDEASPLDGQAQGAEVKAALEGAFHNLAAQLMQVLGRRRYKPRSAASKMLMGCEDAGVASQLASDMFKDVVARCAERSAVNTLCFSAFRKT